MADELNESQGISRRNLIKRGAIVGGTMVWAAPVVNTLTAGPAFASTGTPDACLHSIGRVAGLEGTDCEDEGCMGACQTACDRGCADQLTQAAGCQDACSQLCPNIMGSYPDGSPNNSCCNAGVCDLSNWSCTKGQSAAEDAPCYNGPTTGGLFTCPAIC
jgi:hypothetical protein